jgi:hypothetical protein
MLESDHAVLLATWMRRRRIVFLHIPNEGKRTHIGGAQLRRQGLQRGFPDYLILTPTPLAPRGAALELKREGRDRSSREHRERQAQWLRTLEGLGFRVGYGHGWEEAVKRLEEWGY